MYEELIHAPCYVPDPRVPWDIEQPRREELRLRDALADLPARPDQVDLAAELSTHIARAQAAQGRISDAHDTLLANERRLTVARTLVPRVRQLLERGRLAHLQRTPENARLLLGQAYNAAREAQETFLAIDAAQMLALVEPPKLREAWLTTAVELAVVSTDPAVRRWLPALEMARGWRAFDGQRYDVAMAAFTRASTAFEAAGDVVGTLRARHGRARVLRATDRLDEAIAIQRSIMDAHVRAGRRDARALEEMAECLLALSQPRSAQPLFAEAHLLLSREPPSFADESRLARLQRMGKGARV